MISKKNYVAPLADQLDVELKRMQSILTTFSLSGIVEDYDGLEEYEPEL